MELFRTIQSPTLRLNKRDKTMNRTEYKNILDLLVADHNKALDNIVAILSNTTEVQEAVLTVKFHHSELSRKAWWQFWKNDTISPVERDQAVKKIQPMLESACEKAGLSLIESTTEAIDMTLMAEMLKKVKLAPAETDKYQSDFVERIDKQFKEAFGNPQVKQGPSISKGSRSFASTQTPQARQSIFGLFKRNNSVKPIDDHSAQSPRSDKTTLKK